jgi:8-oxo-dGTP pyrophosphatase MutT (NUDIX family)
MIVERPAESQWQDVVRVYGPPKFLDRARSLPSHAEKSALHHGSGEVILLIFNLASSCVYVRRKGSLDWFYPTGSIGSEEGIIAAARRVAREEAGVEIEPVGVPSCQRIMLSLQGETVLRWHVVVVAETAGNVMAANDRSTEVGLFDIPPAVDDIEMFSWINELHHIGTRYMRSLDAMDGI